MLVTKKVKVVHHRSRGDFEVLLGEAIIEMENREDIIDVEVQFSTTTDDKMSVWFSAMVKGKGLPL